MDFRFTIAVFTGFGIALFPLVVGANEDESIPAIVVENDEKESCALYEEYPDDPGFRDECESVLAGIIARAEREKKGATEE